MKKLILTIVALLSFAAAASAQQATCRSASGDYSRSALLPRLLPKGKIAVINTAAFQQQVLEFKAKVEALNKQFEPRVKEVQGLNDRIHGA